MQRPAAGPVPFGADQDAAAEPPLAAQPFDQLTEPLGRPPFGIPKRAGRDRDGQTLVGVRVGEFFLGPGAVRLRHIKPHVTAGLGTGAFDDRQHAIDRVGDLR